MPAGPTVRFDQQVAASPNWLAELLAPEPVLMIVKPSAPLRFSGAGTHRIDAERRRIDALVLPARR